LLWLGLPSLACTSACFISSVMPRYSRITLPCQSAADFTPAVHSVKLAIRPMTKNHFQSLFMLPRSFVDRQSTGIADGWRVGRAAFGQVRQCVKTREQWRERPIAASKSVARLANKVRKPNSNLLRQNDFLEPLWRAC